MRTALRPALSALGLLLLNVTADISAAPPPNCTAEEYRQFDFWLGAWQVFSPDGKIAGTSRIERITDGCAVLENWAGKGGITGKSLNIYDSSDQQWHQFWVDSSGSKLLLDGKFANGKMILQADAADPKRPGITLTQRITWSKNPDGSVQQLWETSEDQGKTWAVAFNGKYVALKK
jgi:hypothetical protein